MRTCLSGTSTGLAAASRSLAEPLWFGLSLAPSSARTSAGIDSSAEVVARSVATSLRGAGGRQRFQVLYDGHIELVDEPHRAVDEAG